MSSDYRDKRTSKNSQLSSFRLAILGIIMATNKERNLKIHVVISFLVILFGLYFDISKIEWMFIIFAIGFVIAMELMNTAIERVVDLVTKDFHPLAKQAKDIAAGAVFVSAVISAIIGLLIFVPYLFNG